MTNRSRLPIALIVGGVVAITLAAYWPVSTCGFLNFDDPLYVTANDQVRSGLSAHSLAWAFTTVRGGNWHPLTWLSHMLDCQWLGVDPGRQHLVNLFFHISNALLLFLFLLRTTASRWRSGIVAALFALHPLHVESVAWISERKDVLSMFFMLLAMLAYSRYVRRPSVPSYLLVALALALGLMSKAMVVTAPLLLLLLDYWPLQRWQPKAGERQGAMIRRLLMEKLPFALLALIVAAVTWWAQREAGAMEALATIPFPLRLGNALLSVAAYLGQTVWPTNLFIPYPYAADLPWPLVGMAALLLMLISAAVCRVGRGMPYLTVGWFWFLTALLPVIGLIQVGVQARADRYTYLPHVGLFIGLVWGGARVVERLGISRPLVAGSVVAVLVALGATTHRQLDYWRDSKQLFSHALAIDERNPTAHTYLGMAWAAENRWREAEQEYSQALRLQPNNNEALANLGVVLVQEGRLVEAGEYLARAAVNQPGNGKIKNNLGNVAKAQGEFEQATIHYRAALALEPENREILFNLANTLEKLERLPEAISYYRQALARYPDFAEAHNGLGVALAKSGELLAAGQSFQEALNLRPDYRQARENLDWLAGKK